MSAVAAPPVPASAAAPPVTPEDLLRMGDAGKGYDLVDGQLEERAVSFLSSFVAGKAYKALDRHADAGGLGWVVPEGTSFQCFPARGKVRRADTAFIALARLTPELASTAGHCPVAPDLVVEVISPDDRAANVNQKTREWLDAGVRLVWVIDPDARTVFAYHRDRPATADIVREGDTLTGDPVLPGFALPAADLFRFPAGNVAPTGPVAP